MDLDKIIFSHKGIINELYQASENKYADWPDRFRDKIFNPLNIWYIKRDDGKRNSFCVHLDAPVEYDADYFGHPSKEAIHHYKIRVDSTKGLLQILGSDFIDTRKEFLCSRNRIYVANKKQNSFVVRRLGLSEDKRIEFKTDRNIEIPASSNVIRKIKESMLAQPIVFTSESVIEHKIEDFEKIGRRIFSNAMNIAFIKASNMVKEVQLFDSDIHPFYPPLYCFDIKTGIETLLGSNIKSDVNPNGYFIQISKSCFINLYCLLRKELTYKNYHLCFCLGQLDVNLKVSKRFRSEVRDFIKGLEKMN
jgi:hypothetical protein